MLDLAMEIRNIRLKLGLKQSEFGRLLGVSGQTVMRWENRHTLPTREQADLIMQLAKIEKPPEPDVLKQALIGGGMALGLYLLLRLLFKD